MEPIPKNIFLAMIRQHAMTPGKNDRTFSVNYKIVQQQFPAYLEFLVKNNLNQFELWFYENGYIAYTVLDNGLLQWRRTGKPI
jgi:hypothetical protein